MIASLPPATLMMLGALAVPLLRGRLQSVWLLALPVLSAWQMWSLPLGHEVHVQLFDYSLEIVRVDKLSRVFGLIFHVAALISVIYSLHVKDRVQHVSGMIYAGAAIAAVFAGDLITLFVFWELTAIASVFLIWASRNERAYRAGMRYLVIQIGSGVILLAGILFHYAASGSLAFGHLGIETLGGKLIFVAFGIKCAFPFLHNWLQDAYPEATVTGTVFLSAFTTKLAVYALARGYAGTSILIGIGVVMTIFPIFFAVIENNLRRVLAYSLNNQLGFMVCGIGIGTELAINGTVAHAFAHILYKALLFMTMGAVLHRTGTIEASKLGGLYRSMPATTVFCLIGAASISAFPLFSGFVSKSMILSAAGAGGYALAMLGLIFASAGVMEHSGIKIPYFAFFAHDSGIRCKEAPWNMLLAMGIAAFFCIAIGCVPGPLYSLLPYTVEYHAYGVGHVITQLQLLLWATLAFCVLVRRGWYPPEMPSVNLDFDWVYRRLLPNAVDGVMRVGTTMRDAVTTRFHHGLTFALERVGVGFGPRSRIARTWSTGTTVLWIAAILGLFLILYYA